MKESVMGSARILLVIADPMLRQTLADHLAGAAGMEVVLAASVEQALPLCDDPDLVVVDDAPGELDAAATCGLIRQSGRRCPVLVLGNDRSGDAVMPKPLRLGALTAKITEMLALDQIAAMVRIGPWRLDPVRPVLIRTDGRLARLTDKETAILRRLGQAQGRVVGRETLLAEIWGYSARMETHTLETHVYRLRRKLDPSGKAELLVSEDGGYRLVSALS